MASTKTETKSKKKVSTLKSVAWLGFASQQSFVGYVLLSNFDNYVVVAAAVASLLLAFVVVVSHFVRAHR